MTALLTNNQPRLIIFILLLSLLTTACQQGESPTPIAAQTAVTTHTPTRTQTPTPTFTPSFTPSPSYTPTATPTPTITPTPTPTAQPIAISENWRDSQIGPPITTGNAPCGLVDLLDFPLDPPNGANASGGNDFGIFRSRFDKFHAGEDWWGVRGRQSFGEPIYSIGHGLVTYAEPEGWGRDKGVIIILHVFPDGSNVLSFYGHLDPPSVLLEPGDCVERGEQIAQIGRPRSSPHLHFELRTQAPYQTLTGYWPEDPTTVGWLPPSPFIWNQRIRSAPGVLWAIPESLPYALEDVENVGLFQQETLITLQSDQLIGINVQDGRQLWQQENAEDEEEGITAVHQALLDNRFPIVYIANRSGQIAALSLLSDQSSPTTRALQSLWEIELDIFGQPDMLPLPNGGLLFFARDHLFALNSEGSILWQTEDISKPTDWLQLQDRLLLSATGTSGYFGTADANGLHIWESANEDWPENSTLILARDQVWLYNRDGLYQLNLESQTAELKYPLPRGLTSLGDIIGLPDGGILLAHADTADRRLLAFNADGSLRWERSYEEFISGSVQLIEHNGRVYLTNIDNGTLNNTFSIYALDLTNAALTQIFIGGARAGNLGDTWIETAEDHLIININGGPMLAFDPLQVP